MRQFQAIAAAALLAAPTLVQAQVQAQREAPAAISSDPFLGIATYRLWLGRAEGATTDEPDQTPTLTVFRPQEGRANGAAVVVAPGGATSHSPPAWKGAKSPIGSRPTASPRSC